MPNPFDKLLEEEERTQRAARVNPFDALMEDDEAPNTSDIADLNFWQAAARSLSNVPESAGQFAEDITYPIRHPIQTAKGVGNLSKGVYHKFTPGIQLEEELVDAVGEFYSDRYGGGENIKRTLVEDPIGALADLAGVLTVGGSIPRATGKLGKIAAQTKNVGTNIGPVTTTAKLLKATTQLAGKGVGQAAASVLGGTLSLIHI